MNIGKFCSSIFPIKILKIIFCILILFWFYWRSIIIPKEIERYSTKFNQYDLKLSLWLCLLTYWRIKLNYMLKISLFDLVLCNIAKIFVFSIWSPLAIGLSLKGWKFQLSIKQIKVFFFIINFRFNNIG